jgi:hypothetical protein
MIKYFVLFTLSLPLLACQTTSKDWNNPNVPAEQQKMDIAKCKYEAKKYNGGEKGGFFENYLRTHELEELCMESKGYSKASSKMDLY